MRKIHLPKIYAKVINTIRNDVGDNYFWISADETMDALGRRIVNVIIGVLQPDTPTKPYLIASKTLERVNANTMAEVIGASIDNIFEGDTKREKALLFVSDAAAYMIKAGKLLKDKFPDFTYYMYCSCTA